MDLALPITQSQAPAAFSSASVKAVTSNPATNGVPSGLVQSIKPYGPWQSKATQEQCSCNMKENKFKTVSHTVWICWKATTTREANKREMNG